MGTTISIENLPSLDERTDGGKSYTPEQAARVMKACHVFLRDSGIAPIVELIKIVPEVCGSMYAYKVYIILSHVGIKVQTPTAIVFEERGRPEKIEQDLAEQLLTLARISFQDQIASLRRKADRWEECKPFPLLMEFVSS